MVDSIQFVLCFITQITCRHIVLTDTVHNMQVFQLDRWLLTVNQCFNQQFNSGDYVPPLRAEDVTTLLLACTLQFIHILSITVLPSSKTHQRLQEHPNNHKEQLTVKYIVLYVLTITMLFSVSYSVYTVLIGVHLAWYNHCCLIICSTQYDPVQYHLHSTYAYVTTRHCLNQNNSH